jgi:hypothetical protein
VSKIDGPDEQGPGDGGAEAPVAVADDVPEEPARGSRLPLLLAGVGAAVILGAALIAPLVDQVLRGDQRAQRALDLSQVELAVIEDRTHTMADVDYPHDPPMGGAHAPVWLACGVYDEPVREENAVHDLEHGSVWLTHDPDLSAEDVEVLASRLPRNSIVSPRKGLPSPVVVTVWGAQLRLDGPDDRRLDLFVEAYGDGHTAPEFGVTCEGGTPDPQGELPEEGTDA